jgi:crotonobetainyl-CoA:carnitine CoA-transferase CaiB-like acyl-CoA transferase
MTAAPHTLSAHRGALQGIVVVDLSRVFAGPLCTQILADHGAEVTKVEPPTGDETRNLGPPFNAAGDAAYFSSLNRGKRAISLDLSIPEGREVLMRMLESADVLVENFLPGTMNLWGIGYEDVLARRFPRLVYCSISGFGADGPLGGLPGYDAVLQAMCGLMSVNGDTRSGRTRVGIPLVDHLTGYVALVGILMALRVREHTGLGQRVEATLFDTALSLLIPQAGNWFASGATPDLLGSAHPNIAPYDRFAVSDGQIFIGIVNDNQFRRFCGHVGLAELTTDSRFLTNSDRVRNRDSLKEEIERALQSTCAAPLCEGLMKIGVPAGVVNSIPEAFAQSHVNHRQLLVEQGGCTGIRSPTRLYGTPGTPGGRPPGFAEDTATVLAELGFDEEGISRLQRSGAIPSERTGGSKPRSRLPDSESLSTTKRGSTAMSQGEIE